jgi:hypothetical protein
MVAVSIKRKQLVVFYQFSVILVPKVTFLGSKAPFKELIGGFKKRNFA